MRPNAAPLMRLLGLALAAAALLLLPSSALAQRHAKRHHHRSHHHRSHHGQRHDGDHHGNSAGAVYTATNDPNGNSVIVFRRNHDGTLTQRATVPTGGTGVAAQPPFTFPIVDSQGSIALARDGRLLFVVNDGDNTITSFRTTGDGLKRVDRVSSGGVLPVSLTTHGHLLYAVNEISSSIAGFNFSGDGRLRSIPGSAQPLSPLFPSSPTAVGGVAADIGFSPDGQQLVVTERGVPQTTGAIDTFKVNSDGTATFEQALTCPTLGTPCAAVDPNPFGFAFTPSGQLLVSNVGQVNGPIDYPAGSPPLLATPPQAVDPAEFKGSASSYSLSSTGKLSTISSQVASGGRGACWLVVSKDGTLAFVTNTLSTTPDFNPATGIGSGGGALTTYTVSGGALTHPVQADTGPGTPTDEAVSADGKFLYVSVPFVPPPPGTAPTSHIDVFAIGATGITPITHGATMPGFISGLAAN